MCITTVEVSCTVQNGAVSTELYEAEIHRQITGHTAEGKGEAGGERKARQQGPEGLLYHRRLPWQRGGRPACWPVPERLAQAV